MKERHNAYTRITVINPEDRVVIMHDLAETPAATEVDSWPPHITLVEPFYPKQPLGVNDIHSLLEDNLNSLSSITVIPASRTIWLGHQLDIPATPLNSSGIDRFGESIESGSIELLHRRILGSLATLEMVDFSEEYFQYLPHISAPSREWTHKAGGFTLDTLSIGVKFGSTRQKRIADVVTRS